MFPFSKDNCSELWNIKKYVFDNIDVDLVFSSDWMIELAKDSPILQNQKNYHKIPLGIDIDKFSSIDYESARKKLNIKKDEIVLFFRSQNEFKGTPYIVEALKKLKTDKKITLLTCDNKGLISEVEDKYKIIELGHINDKEMIVAMNACDIFLMPSIGESFGMMAIEAMSCSKPVIVFDNSALPSVTHAPECGYLVSDRNSHDLMKAIDDLVSNEKERIRRGNLAKKIVQEEYTEEAYNQRLKELYKKVMNRKRSNVEIKDVERDLVNEYNFKDYLNRLSIRIFGNEKEIIDKLVYNIDKSYINKKQKIKYDDINVQKILESYLINIEEITHDKTTSVKMKNAIQRAIYFLLYDRKMLKEKIVNRLKKEK